MQQVFLNYYNHCLIKIEAAPPALVKYLGIEVPQLLSRENSSSACINVRYVDRIEPAGSLYFIGEQAAFDSKTFYIFDWPYKVAVDMRKLSMNEHLEVVCEYGFDPIRLFGYVIEPLVAIKLLYSNVAFVHASSVCFRGNGLLFPAWQHTGKTYMLLQFLQSGATFMADDWSIIEDGFLLAYPKRVNMFDYNLKVFPEYKKHLPLFQRGFLRFFGMMEEVRRQGGHRLSSNARKVLELISGASMRLINTKLAAEQLGARLLFKAPLNGVILLLSGTDTWPKLIGLSKAEAAVRMTTSFVYEMKLLFDYAYAYSFAFPRADLLDWVGKIRQMYKDTILLALHNDSVSKIMGLQLPMAVDRNILSECVDLIMCDM